MSYKGVSTFNPNHSEWLKDIARVLNAVQQGRTNNYGTVTLTANSGTTTVTLPEGKISIYSVINFEPTTAHAATEWGAGTMYRSATDPDSNTFTITHVNNAQTDRIFNYAIIG
jgi:hypothetical protein